MVALRRGSLRATEGQTEHNYETIAAWLRRIGAHAEAVTEVLVRDLDLSEVELDALWSFVGKEGGAWLARGSADSLPTEQGERWGGLSQDRTSRFVVAWSGSKCAR